MSPSAVRYGRIVGRARRPAADSPYKPSDGPAEQVLAAVWIRAYLKANPDSSAKFSFAS